MARMPSNDDALPTMADHADALHPLHTQPDRQMAPAENARQLSNRAAANPKIDKGLKDAAAGQALVATWNQMTDVSNAKAKMRERGY